VPVVVKNIKTGKTSEYLTMTEAEKACSVSRTTIKNILQSGKILRESYIITLKNSFYNIYTDCLAYFSKYCTNYLFYV